MAEYKTSFSPNEERFGFKTVGTFRCAHKAESLLYIGVTGILLVILFVIALMYSGIAVGGLDIFYGYFLPIGIAFLGYGVALNFLKTGHQFRYSANEEFIDILPESKEIAPLRIYYADAVAVEYEPFKLFWITRGLKVRITAKTGTFEYRCIYPKWRITTTMNKFDLPFYIIEERAGLKQKKTYTS